MRIVRGVIAAAIATVALGTAAHAAGASTRAQATAFDQITYSDSGGFAGSGTGKSLSVTRDGRVEARTRNGTNATLTLPDQELSELNNAVAAVDWKSLQQRYVTPNAADLIVTDLTVLIRGEAHEVHVDSLAKTPPALQELFRRLDALHRRATSSNPSR